MAAFERMQRERRGLAAGAAEIVSAVREMPHTMKQLAAVQFFTWLGLFCMWLFYVPAVARHVFGATDPQSELYTRGVEWGNFTFSIYSIVCFAVAFALPKLRGRDEPQDGARERALCGSVGLLSVWLIREPWLLVLSMCGVGIAWASILSMPYAILAGSLPPARMGVYMGVFNFFIVLPEILQALTFGPLIRTVVR